MSLTSYRAAPPRDSGGRRAEVGGQLGCSLKTAFRNSGTFVVKRIRDAGRGTFSSVLGIPFSVLCRPGDDLLSRVLRQSTIGAEAFDGRVRDGIGSYRLARATRPAKGGNGGQR